MWFPFLFVTFVRFMWFPFVFVTCVRYMWFLFVFLFSGSYDRPEREHREPPKRGNTLYVHGIGINEDMLRKSFSNFGKIVNINMETDKRYVL